MKKYNLLSIKQLYQLDLAVLMFKYHNHSLPLEFSNIFKIRFLKVQTRSSSNIIMPSLKNAVSQQSIKFSGPKRWNRIPNDIKNSKSINLFRKKMKHYLIANT